VIPTQKRPPEHPKTAAEGLGLAGRPWLRRLIGAGLVLHLTAVAVAPLSVLVVPREEPPGGGPLRPGAENTGPGAENGPADLPDAHKPAIDWLEEYVFRPYLDLLYLNHGYSFFAPEPGPSYVIEYEVRRKDGSVERGRLPDIEKHRPRLMYHRYFMLATQNFGLMMDAEARGKITADSTNTLARAIAREVTRRYEGEYGVLRLLTHRLLWPEEVLAGKSPSAPDTFLPGGQIVHPPSAEEVPAANGPADATRPEEVTP